jgi:hypothetical protein
MKLPLLALVAAAAVMAIPGTAEAKSKHRHYSKHYYKHYSSRHYSHGSYCREHGRHRHYYGGRSTYYYGSHRWAYGYPRYYSPYRSGVNVHVNL